MRITKQNIDRRAVIEAYAKYDCSKKGHTIPTFETWDWSQADASAGVPQYCLEPPHFKGARGSGLVRAEMKLTPKYSRDPVFRMVLSAYASCRRPSREAAPECSPRREPWEGKQENNKLRRSERNLAHTAGNLVLHLIFSTKGRQPLITTDIRDDLHAYLGGIIREMQGTALIINGTADHVHMLVRIRPAQAAAEVARLVKANSSKWVHEKWNVRFAWQRGYGAFSVSESNVPAVSRYIATQEEHHKKRTFQDEYVAFLKKNNVAYNEQYLWD
jgi:putative transposase